MSASEAGHMERAKACPNVSSRLDLLDTFLDFATEDRLCLTQLPLALLDLGFDFEEKHGAGLLPTDGDDSLSLQQFESVIARCTLHDNDFPIDVLHTMFAKLPCEDGVLDVGEVENMTREKLNRFLRSNGVDLDSVDVGSRVSLTELELLIATELDLKRKSEWLMENGVVRSLASILPRSIFSPSKSESCHARVEANISQHFPGVGNFILARSKLGPLPAANKGLRNMSDESSPFFVPDSRSDAIRLRENSKRLAQQWRSVRLGSISPLQSIGPFGSPTASLTREHGMDDAGSGRKSNFKSAWRRASHAGGRGFSWEWTSEDEEGGGGSSLRSKSFHRQLSVGSRPGEGRTRYWWEQFSGIKSGEHGSGFRPEDVSWDEGPLTRGERCRLFCSVLSNDFKGLLNALSWELVLIGLVLWALMCGVGTAVILFWHQDALDVRQFQVEGRVTAAQGLLDSHAALLSGALTTLSSAIASAPALQQLPEFAASFPIDGTRATEREGRTEGRGDGGTDGRREGARGSEDSEDELVQPAPSFEAVSAFEAVASVLLAEGWGQGGGGGATCVLQLAPGGIVTLEASDGAAAPWSEIGLNVMREEQAARAVEQGGGVVELVRKGEQAQWLRGVMPVVQEARMWGLAIVWVEAEALLAAIDEELGEVPDLVYLLQDQDGAVLHASDAVTAADASTAVWQEVHALHEHGSGHDHHDMHHVHADGKGGKSGVHVTVSMLSSAWTLGAEWKERWWWMRLGLACVVVFSGLLACVCVALLTTRKQHRALLFRIMPPRVVKRLQQGRQVAEIFDDVTIFFSDLVGFTDMSTRHSPLQVVMMLNDLYTELDKIAERHKVFKVDTIGDAYMVIGGAPDRCSGPEAAARVAAFALDALKAVQDKEAALMMRAGMASGSVVGAVLGTAMPKYSFFGDTVNTASRMESSGRPGRLQVTEETMMLLAASEHMCEFSITERGTGGMLVKGKGRLKTFWVSAAGTASAGDSSRDMALPYRSHALGGPHFNRLARGVSEEETTNPRCSPTGSEMLEHVSVMEPSGRGGVLVAGGEGRQVFKDGTEAGECSETERSGSRASETGEQLMSVRGAQPSARRGVDDPRAHERGSRATYPCRSHSSGCPRVDFGTASPLLTSPASTSLRPSPTRASDDAGCPPHVCAHVSARRCIPPRIRSQEGAVVRAHPRQSLPQHDAPPPSLDLITIAPATSLPEARTAANSAATPLPPLPHLPLPSAGAGCWEPVGKDEPARSDSCESAGSAAPAGVGLQELVVKVAPQESSGTSSACAATEWAEGKSQPRTAGWVAATLGVFE